MIFLAQCPQRVIHTPPMTVNCTQGRDVGSYCDFDCTDEGQLMGSSRVKCQIGVNGDAVWSHEFPECQRKWLNCILILLLAVCFWRDFEIKFQLHVLNLPHARVVRLIVPTVGLAVQNVNFLVIQMDGNYLETQLSIVKFIESKSKIQNCRFLIEWTKMHLICKYLQRNKSHCGT